MAPDEPVDPEGQRYWLRATRRCICDDLGLAENDAWLPIDEVDDPVCVVFLEKRGNGSPEGQETIQALKKSHVYSLHIGDHRGATWYDRLHRVVWLLSVRFHRKDRPDDAYPFFAALETTESFYPTADDYERLFELQEERFVDALLSEPQEMLDEARASHVEVRRLLGGTVPVSVFIDAEDGVELVYVAVSQSWVAGGLEPPSDWSPILLAAFFPWIDSGRCLDEVETGPALRHRQRRDDELVFLAIRDVPT